MVPLPSAFTVRTVENWKHALHVAAAASSRADRTYRMHTTMSQKPAALNSQYMMD